MVLNLIEQKINSRIFGYNQKGGIPEQLKKRPRNRQQKKMDTISIHTSKTEDKVKKFVKESEFKKEIIEMRNDGILWGCYYNESGDIVAQDIWGDETLALK